MCYPFISFCSWWLIVYVLSFYIFLLLMVNIRGVVHLADVTVLRGSWWVPRKNVCVRPWERHVWRSSRRAVTPVLIGQTWEQKMKLPWNSHGPHYPRELFTCAEYKYFSREERGVFLRLRRTVTSAKCTTPLLYVLSFYIVLLLMVNIVCVILLNPFAFWWIILYVLSFYIFLLLMINIVCVILFYLFAVDG